MKRIRILGLCLVAVFIASAVLAAASSATLPTFNGPFPKPFTSKSKEVRIETVGKTTVTCKASTDAGKVTGPKAAVIKLRFTGCEARSAPCSNAGPGEVLTSTMSGTLGYISRAARQVGFDFVFPGAAIASFTCGNLRVSIVGSIIGRILPVDKKVNPPTPFTLAFVQAAGKQKFTKLEGGAVDVLKSSVNGGALEESGLSCIDSVTFAAPTRINA